jgi:hypothetical protein
MQLTRQSILVPKDLDITTSPKFPLRGHQLGYRPKVNAYDAWSPEQYDQYIRELAIFGSNSIEIMPPRTDDHRLSPHMKVPPMEMMIKLSEIIDSYGLDVWIWYPNMGDDYTQPDSIKKELKEREDIFKKLKRIDHILVPGGDPGDLHTDVLFPWLDKMGNLLQKYHPEAKIWVSPQKIGPTQGWLDSFYDYVNQKPNWLGGVVFAPWVQTPLPKMRKIVDKDIKIRRYPDITHSVVCQYPVRDWDLAYAYTLHRECYNPRPVAMKHIHNLLDEYACGTVTYTEGISDDVNKFIWGDQDWDPRTPVIETLRDFSRLFIHPEFSDGIAQGLFSLEKNWEGPLISNSQVEITLQQWQTLEKILPPIAKTKYRFQMGVLRAYYDAYIKHRLIYETHLEMQAREVLRTTQQIGSLPAIEKALEILDKAKNEPVVQNYKKKCEALADSLFEKIGSQLTVKKHQAKWRTRGAFMDGIDEPLNDIRWLQPEFKKIQGFSNEGDRVAAIDKLLNRTNPGSGGFYDNMGSPGSRNRLLNEVTWEDDPGTLSSPRFGFYYNLARSEIQDSPLAWKNQVTTFYETPLHMAYDNLDPTVSYKLRITYVGSHLSRNLKIQLMADGQYEIHNAVDLTDSQVMEYPIPREATADGGLILTWTRSGRQFSIQIAEIWLIRSER